MPVLRLPSVAAALAAGRPLRIVALGSSSTEGVGASSRGATYPAQLEADLRAALPGQEIEVINKGVSGQDASEMLQRLESDALSLHPTLLIWQVGVNGALRRNSPLRFREMITAGVDQARAAGVDVLLMDSQRGAWARAAPERAAFDQVLADLADLPGVALFPRGALMDAWTARGAPPEAMLIPDGLHHNDRGYACLSAAVAEAMIDGVPRAHAATLATSSR
ncbi:lysophospholipase L1-like esterase [Humitalea rosea]|uniref:Lysophospholipase L1-like esterase n=2 Tax=Humitalea rosea TaxID=990373 RepID=A0A2W7IIH6_9PROT|nr:lysophospholipase L1-like esterase [Humitalea rosea]